MRTPEQNQIEREELIVKSNLLEGDKHTTMTVKINKSSTPTLDKRSEEIKKKGEFIWKQKFYDEGGKNLHTNNVSMFAMDKNFLQNISYKIQNKMLDLQRQMDIQMNLLEQVDYVANEKGYELKEVENKNYKRIK